MKRFYKDVSVAARKDGHAVLLDGKPVRTPGGNALILPSESLASAIAAEWRDQGEDIIAASMPLLRLSNTVIDGVAVHRQPQFVVMIVNLRELLPHHRFNNLVIRSPLDVEHLRLCPQFLMLYVERERGVLEYGSSLQDHVVPDLPGGSDPYLNSPIGRAQREAGFRDSAARKCG